MWTNKYLVFLLGVPNFLFKTGLWKVSFRSTFYNAAARVLFFFLFCVPREGGGTITSPLLTFAGTDCNVSGSFPISKHISSERHRESNSVYPCKTLLSYNTERWTSAIVSVTNKQDFVWAPVTMWAGESGKPTAAATLHLILSLCL